MIMAVAEAFLVLVPPLLGGTLTTILRVMAEEKGFIMHPYPSRNGRSRGLCQGHRMSPCPNREQPHFNKNVTMVLVRAVVLEMGQRPTGPLPLISMDGIELESPAQGLSQRK